MESTPEWRCHVYGASRSGKTEFITPVLYLGPSETRPETHSSVCTFFMHPSMSPPMGELNGPSDVWNSRLYPHAVLWDGFDLGNGNRIQAWTPEHLIATGLPLVFQSGKIPPFTERAQRELNN